MSTQRFIDFMTVRIARIAVLSGWFVFMAAPAWAEDAALPEPAAGAAQAAVAEGFDILEYAVHGNTVLPRERIEDAVYPHLGEGKTIADVDLARAALEKAYQDAGYLTVFVNLPEQKVENGIVQLEVREGKVDRLKVTGSRYYSLGAIKALAPALEEGNVPNFHDVQKELGDLNRNPGRRITPVLRSGRVPGTVEAELKVDDQLPLHASVEVNDRYSRDTTETRLNAAVRYDNLWQAGHSLNLSLQIAPEDIDESRVLVASYVAPLDSGNVLAGYAVASDTDVTTVGGVSSIGKGNILGLRYIMPLRGRPGMFHSLSLGADYKDYDDTTRFEDDTSNLPIAYLPFTLGYDLTLSGRKAQTQIGLSTVFGLRDLVNDQDEFESKRTNGALPGGEGVANFIYFKADLKHTLQFENKMRLLGKLGLQYTDDPLISNEQMAAGGADTVRGYPESAALGDKGWRLGLELQGPSLARPTRPWLDELYFLGFAEAAGLDYLEPAAGQDDRFELASVGLGLRFKAGKHYSGALDFAQALQDAGGVEEGDSRWHFRLGAEW